MKKNTLTRSASILFALALVTTSIVSGTYAKYVTEDSTKDTARVAKWGVLISAEGNLFSDAYLEATQTDGNTPTAWNQSNITAKTISVAANGENAKDSLVAPGTQSSGDGLTLQVTGTPEVITQLDVTVKAQDIYLAKGTYATMQPITVNEASFSSKVSATNNGLYTATTDGFSKVESTDDYDGTEQYYQLSGRVSFSDADYYPVIYTNNNAATSATAIATAIATSVKNDASVTLSDGNSATAIVDFTTSNTYAANTDLSTVGVGTNNIKWSWAYSTSDANDLKDTILGNLISSKIDEEVTVVKLDADGEASILTVDGDDIVHDESDNEVASVRTYLDITVTATQQD